MSAFIDGYELDVAVSEDHSFEADVTEHPVEIGADVSDHVRARPVTVTIEGIVSDTPIGGIADRRGDRLADVGVITVSASAAGPGPLQFKPSDDMLAWFDAMRERREPVEIRTSLRTYENMMLRSLSIPRSATNGDALRFTATFVQIIIVENERTLVRVSVPRASNKTNKGNQTSPEVPGVPIEIAAPWLLRDDPTLPKPTAANAGGRQLAAFGGSGSGTSPSGLPLTASGGG